MTGPIVHVVRRLLAGATAGAAGTVALDAATYLDMALRARPASEVPAESVRRLARRRGIRSLAGDDDTAANRRSGAGGLLGALTGTAVGAAWGLVRPARPRWSSAVEALIVGGLAMAAGDAGAVSTGATDPRSWSAPDWIADIVPHLCYGWAAALVLRHAPRWWAR